MKVIPFMAWRRFAAGFSLLAMLVAGGALATRSELGSRFHRGHPG